MYIQNINIALIGLGQIATHYGCLQSLENVRLKKVVDINENAPARNIFANVPFSTDYRELYGFDGCVVVATSVNRHYEIIKDLMEHGVSVISEKPLTDCLAKVEELYDVSAANGTKLISMYHWQNAEEVMWIKQQGGLQNVKSVKLHIHDNYACNNHAIRPDRYSLNGCLKDELPNAFSLIDSIAVPLEEIDNVEKLKVEKVIFDNKTGDEIFCSLSFVYEGVEIEIVIDWTEDSMQKVFEIECEDSTTLIEHSKKEIHIDGVKVHDYSKIADHLSYQYEHYFKSFDTMKTNEKLTRFIFGFIDRVVKDRH